MIKPMPSIATRSSLLLPLVALAAGLGGSACGDKESCGVNEASEFQFQGDIAIADNVVGSLDFVICVDGFCVTSANADAAGPTVFAGEGDAGNVYEYPLFGNGSDDSGLVMLTPIRSGEYLVQGTMGFDIFGADASAQGNVYMTISVANTVLYQTTSAKATCTSGMGCNWPWEQCALVLPFE